MSLLGRLVFQPNLILAITFSFNIPNPHKIQVEVSNFSSVALFDI